MYFHQQFVAADERIAKLFENIDIDRQERMMIHSLTHVSLLSLNEEKHSKLLHNIIEQHQKYHIDSHLYECWRVALLTSIAKFDEEFSPELERQWNQTVDEIIKAFKR